MNVNELRSLYESETGSSWTDSDGKIWLAKNRERFEIYYKEPRLAKKLHLDLSDKMNWLSQLHCHICNPDFPICMFPIRIEPESYQALDKINREAFKLAIKGEIEKSKLEKFSEEKICISILFVCGSIRKTKDLDNMAKLLIDSIKDLIVGDDKHVDHLNIVRLAHDFAEESIFIRISNSNLNLHENVVAQEFNHSWAGKERLLLSDFYKKA